MTLGTTHVVYPHSLQVDLPSRHYRDEPSLGIDSNNFYYSRGALRLREGLSEVAVTTDTKNINGMYAFIGENGSHNLITATENHIYKSSSPNYGALTDITGGTSLTAAETRATVFAPALNASKTGFVATNNVDPPFFWLLGDASRTILTNAPGAARTVTSAEMGVGGTRIVFGNTGESGTRFSSRVRWSALNDVTTYPAAAFADLLATQDTIVAVRAFSRLAFAIYKDKSQWIGRAQQGSDAASFSFEHVDSQIGPIGPQAVCDGPAGTHLYIGRDANIYAFDGSATRIISRVSDFFEAALSASRSENNSILYDPFRNVIDVSLWPDIEGSSLVLVTADPGISGLVLITTDPGVQGLLLATSRNLLISISLENNQIYPLSIDTLKMRSRVKASDVSSNLIVSGIDNKICLSRSGKDSFSSGIAGQAWINIPIIPRKVIECDQVEFLYELYSTADNVTFSVWTGNDYANIEENVLFNGSIKGKARSVFNAISASNPLGGVRGRYVRLSISGNFQDTFRMNRLEASIFPRDHMSGA